MDAADDTVGRLRVTPLSAHIGARIEGLDLGARPDAETVDAVRRAWLDHQVIVLPGQTMTPEDQVRVTGWFGEVGALSRPQHLFPKGYESLPPGVMMISNIRENGEPIGALPDGEMMFHHDMIHAEVPSKATMLHAVEIPSEGGDTLFASGYAAYETLAPELKGAVEGRRALNRYDLGATKRGGAGDHGSGAVRECDHPVVRTHEETGRRALYVNRLMTVAILGMPEDESDEILQRLFDHAEQDQFVYRHRWSVGDLLLWDNRCSTHARTDFPADQRRLMFRTTIRGEVRPH